MDDDLKARLLKPRLAEDTIDIEGVGTVRVRALSRGEVFAIQKAARDDDIADHERKFIARGLVDPVMTEEEVGLWQRNAPAGELEPIGVKIRDLSGIGKGADKSGLPDVREGSGDGVRVPAGDGPVDDGGRAAGADE